MKGVKILSTSGPTEPSRDDPTLPNSWYPKGTIAKYAPDGKRVGTYNRNFYRVERYAPGISPENVEEEARDLMIRMLKDPALLMHPRSPLRMEVERFIGKKAMRAGGLI